MAIYYVDMETTLIENTTMQKRMNDALENPHYGYTIKPNEGYVLHDKRMDTEIYDDEGNPTGEVILGYRTSKATCTIAQFEANTYEFYAVLATEVPADQIFGVVNPSNPEVM